MTQSNNSPKAFTAGEALAAYRRVKLSGSSVVYAGAGDDSVGVSQAICANAGIASIEMLNKPGTQKLTASAAIAAGNIIYGAASGKVSAVPTGKGIGFALEAATADGDIIECLYTNIDPEFAGMTFEAISASTLTLDAEDVGKVIYFTADCVVTLPATAINIQPIVLMNGGADASVLITVSPNASDKIMAANVAGVDNKDWLNTKATAKRGDYVMIVADGVAGWVVTKKRGTWAIES